MKEKLSERTKKKGVEKQGEKAGKKNRGEKQEEQRQVGNGSK